MKLATFICFLFYNIALTCSSKEEIVHNFGKEYIDSRGSSEENNDQARILQNSQDETQETRLTQRDDEQYAIEKEAGNMRDLFGINVHFRQPDVYEDLGRRSMFNNHPYSNGLRKGRNRKDVYEDRLTPVKAPPELVLAVAKAALKARAENEVDDKDDIILKKMLRTGEYWDSVWVEHVDPEKMLKTRKDDLSPKLGTVKTQVMPGTELYRLISVLKQISPRLVYVMNTAQRK